MESQSQVAQSRMPKQNTVARLETFPSTHLASTPITPRTETRTPKSTCKSPHSEPPFTALTLGTRVAEDRGGVDERGGNLATSADRASGGRDGTTNGYVAAAREGLDGRVVVEDHDDLGEVGTDLETPSDTWRSAKRAEGDSPAKPTSSGNAARGTPAAVRETRNNDTGAGLAREHKARLEDREDGNT